MIKVSVSLNSNITWSIICDWICMNGCKDNLRLHSANLPEIEIIFENEIDALAFCLAFKCTDRFNV